MAGLVAYASSDEEDDIQEVNSPEPQKNVSRYPSVFQFSILSNSH